MDSWHQGTNRLVVIGGGAAGFFCAVNAARLHPGLEVVLLEKTGKLLSKVKVSGGGRCNVTHALDSIPEMIKRYPRGGRFLKKSFTRFFTADTVRWYAERGVRLKTEEDGRMFPDTDSSQTIIDCLLREADHYGVQVLTHSDVEKVEYHMPQTGHGQTERSEQDRPPTAASNGHWLVHMAGGRSLRARYVCIAAGGYAQAGKYSWLQALGHHIEEPAPSLFTFNMPQNPVTALMGVTVPRAQLKIAGSKLQETGPLLITHWGMSGPAVLRLSAWGARYLQEQQYTFTLLVNWLPDHHENSLREAWAALRLEMGGQMVHTRNPFGLPQRLWQFLLQQSGIHENARWAELPAREQNKLIRLLTAMEFPVKGKTTFKEEFVTCGGVQLAEIDPLTMCSRAAPNLYFAGEVMDVDGITGGFNFQHAWTSGWIAAQLGRGG
ncbi:NAD(P)/FAD-dependent oxidoreductase [Chitinophaga alhagiae]|uniref:NAD(P)/FAD-dependent oxidoreductase n=1 Tax=Chitinophaga alhagiae TaxID=2203219 RepID=UPI000E5C4121|nr:NAD(P)/FAD-dependent oxidoreductase [Chitinophaga alhagiae]